jgi:hypothetical protein
MAAIIMAAGKGRPLILVLRHTLARIDAVLRLRWEVVKFAQKTLILCTKKRTGDNMEPDEMPMSPQLEEVGSVEKSGPGRVGILQLLTRTR